MKKIITCLLAVLLLASMKSTGQIQKGNMLVGGDIANFNLGLDGGGNFSVLVDPKIAWFIRDNLAVGGYLSLGLSTAKGSGTSVSYGIGSLARYYFGKDAINTLRHARFFLEGNIGIEGDNPAVGNNTNGLGLGIGPGWTYFVTPNIGLEALLKYNGIVGFGSKPTSNDLRLSVGFQIYLPTSRVKAMAKEAN